MSYISENIDIIKERLRGSFIAFNDFFDNPSRIRGWRCRIYRVIDENDDLIVAKIVNDDEHNIYWGFLIAYTSDINDIGEYQMSGNKYNGSASSTMWKCDGCSEFFTHGAHCLECNFDLCEVCEKTESHPHSLFTPTYYFGLNTYEMTDSVFLDEIDLIF